MKKKTLFLLIMTSIMVVGMQRGSAQSNLDKTSSYLHQKLNESNSVTNRVWALPTLKRNFIPKPGAAKMHIDGATLLMNRAEVLSHQLRNSKFQGTTLLIAAFICKINREQTKGLLAAQKALNIFSAINDISNQAEAFILKGLHYGDFLLDLQLPVKKHQLQASKSQQEPLTRNIMLIGSSMLILLLAIGYNRYRLKQNSHLLLKAQQKEINQQNHALLLLNEKQKILLKEKEWLLKEIHHRVKNNLQITMSLLNIQSAYMVNIDALEAIQNSQRRMQAMSLIHQKLYQSENLALIDMSVYIPELVAYLKEGFDKINLIKFDLQIPSLELDIAQAVPLGLILNEAITNAIKYAFPGESAGEIQISITEMGMDWYTLTVADNGVGLPDTFELNLHNSLGMNLMKGLTEQLQGEFTIQNDGGAKISVVFASVNLMAEELSLIQGKM